MKSLFSEQITKFFIKKNMFLLFIVLAVFFVVIFNLIKITQRQFNWNAH